MSAHTKGPFSVEEMTHGTAIKDGLGRNVAWCGQSTSSFGSVSVSATREHAKLFAAAPDLAEALKALVDHANGESSRNLDVVLAPGCGLLDAARAALKKAGIQ